MNAHNEQGQLNMPEFKKEDRDNLFTAPPVLLVSPFLQADVI